METSSHESRHRRDDIHETPDVSYIMNEDVTHEHTDVRVKPIAWFVFWLFIFGLVVHVLMWGLLRFFESRQAAYNRENPPPAMARQGKERLPPEPRLQLAPGFGAEGKDLSQQNNDPSLRIPQAEMRVVREKWQQELTTYGWVDQQNGIVRIPIERAKQMLLEKGVPARQGTQQQQGQAQPAQGNNVPSQSSSGQQTEKKEQ